MTPPCSPRSGRWNLLSLAMIAGVSGTVFATTNVNEVPNGTLNADRDFVRTGVAPQDTGNIECPAKDATAMIEIAPVGEFTPRRALGATSAPVGENKLEQPVVIADGRNWTLVPKGAFLHIPRDFEGRVNVAPVGVLLGWAEFSRRNRAWIVCENIGAPQVSGSQPIDPQRRAYLRQHPKIVVAVHQGNPTPVIDSDESNQTASTR